ncbi:hypothetical protein [Halomarina oriensis]|uniref:DUF7973 domain-containing protein n=1 Tax=Halomarina oriensis TaxID=671145 RepID=A0A6B0GM42_9EURY|nr:hypothetical protein [Halomarina oriensis]MWG35720.1 hypothetical protein [Halomarina oriensis]
MSVVAVVAVAAVGGALGAALGGYLSLGVLGCLVVVGQLLAYADVALPAAVPTPLGYTVWFGPHVLFGGGVAAAAYAVRRGYMDEGYRYHPAKDVTTPLSAHPKALAVGGAFGVLGGVFAWGYATLGVPFDPITAAVVLSAFAHRVLLGYPLVGEVRSGLLDMSPYERGERREPMTDGGRVVESNDRPAESSSGVPNVTTRFVVEPFAPWQADWRSALALGVVVGLPASVLASLTASALLAFGLAAAALLGFVVREEVPVCYHVALASGMAVLALGPADATAATFAASVSLPVAVVVGTVGGVVVAVFGELLQRVFYAHAETHFDAPFAAVFLFGLCLGLLDIAGVATLPF